MAWAMLSIPPWLSQNALSSCNVSMVISFLVLDCVGVFDCVGVDLVLADCLLTGLVGSLM